MATHLDHVLLDARALVAAKNGEQLVVRDEEEAGEGVPLGVQVVVEALLAALQASVDHLQVLESVLGVAGVQHQRVLGGLCHDLEGEREGGSMCKGNCIVTIPLVNWHTFNHNDVTVVVSTAYLPRPCEILDC